MTPENEPKDQSRRWNGKENPLFFPSVDPERWLSLPQASGVYKDQGRNQDSGEHFAMETGPMTKWAYVSTLSHI